MSSQVKTVKTNKVFVKINGITREIRKLPAPDGVIAFSLLTPNGSNTQIVAFDAVTGDAACTCPHPQDSRFDCCHAAAIRDACHELFSRPLCRQDGTIDFTSTNEDYFDEYEAVARLLPRALRAAGARLADTIAA